MKRSVPLVLAVALFMEQMDSTVIATSLPAIAADLDTSPIALKLALTAYLVSVAIFIPISGWMADRFGAKRLFRCAIGVFILGSLACAFANSLGAFVGARFFQGMGGAMMTPVARLVLVRATERSELVNAMAMLTIPALVGPMIGPPVGGFITTYFSWHWIFLINVPIGLAGIFFAGRILPEMPGFKGDGVDAVGFLLSGFAAAGLVFGLSLASLPVLPAWVGAATIATGIACTLAYIRHARRHPAPIVNLQLFRIPVFRKAIAGASIFRLGIGAVPFLLPLFFQLVFGLSPLASGLLTFVSAGGALLMKFMASRILRIGGFRTVLVATALAGGMFILVNGFFTSSTPNLVIMSVLLAAGFFRSLFFTSANALVFADVETRDTSQATTISAALQQISLAAGVAIAGGVLEIAPAVTGSQALDHTSFMIAFSVAGGLAALAAIPFCTMHRSAGAAMSGHRQPVSGQAAAQPSNV